MRVWQTAFAATALVAAFFAVATLLPLDTMGDPAWDIPMLRARWYFGYLIFYVHLAAIVLTAIFGAARRSLWGGVALGLLGACLYVMLTEEPRFQAHGDLAGRHADAMVLLAWSRGATLVLSVAAVLALWRAGR